MRKILALPIFSRFFNDWWNRSEEIYLLTPKEMFPFTSLCTYACSRRPALGSFRDYLWRQEAGRGSEAFKVSIVYFEYHAAHLMRLFLHRVMMQIPTAVVAGSYPAAMHMQTKGIDVWRPRHIDIFLFEEAHMTDLQEIYDVGVCRPLGNG